jgi:DNA primase
LAVFPILAENSSIRLISQDAIGNILSATRIEEVIGDFVSLKRRGVNLLGLCPFHNEKTPSFTVSPAKGIYKCFGCGKAGNTVNFLMEYEHFSYPEALKFLAKRYHIEIEEEEQTAEQIKEKNEKESLFLLNQFAQNYFSKNLFESEEGKAVGLSYMKERGFREDTIKKFGIGYSAESWDDFSRYASENGYDSEYLIKTGLSIQKESRLIDRFHGRVIFPIQSVSGRIIGFGGRILSGEKTVAKYLNSPESEIYYKSKSLYGIYFAKNAIVSADNCFLVEGYTDVISLTQAGFENVVASSGTSLTQDQVKLIQRYTSNITILYDGDPAGIKASMRGIDMILEQGMNVKIVLFPEGEDPDSFVRNSRTADVESFIAKNSVNFILFKTRLLFEETLGDPIKKAALIKEIVGTIALIPDGISRSVYVKECSSTMNVPEQTLLNELNKTLRKKFSKKIQEESGYEYIEKEVPEFPASKQTEYDVNSGDSQEKEIIRLLLLYGNAEIVFEQVNEDKETEKVSVKIADFILQDILSDEIKFENSLCQRIFDEFAGFQQKGILADKDYFLLHSDPDIASLSIDLCIIPYVLSGNWEKNQIFVNHESEKLKDSVCSAVLAFKAIKIERMMVEIQKKIKESGSNEDLMILMNQLVKLKATSMEIHDPLGRIIIR